MKGFTPLNKTSVRVVGDGWEVGVGVGEEWSGKPRHQKVTEDTGELSNDSARKLLFKPETNANCCRNKYARSPEI